MLGNCWIDLTPLVRVGMTTVSVAFNTRIPEVTAMPLPSNPPLLSFVALRLCVKKFPSVPHSLFTS
jgi:hypothetical protein